MHIGFVIILSIFLLFSGSLVFIWSWYLRNESEISNKIYNTAMKAYQNSKYSTAESLFLRAISVYYHNFKAHYQLGLTNLKLYKYDKAKSCFEKVIKNDANNVDAKFWLAYTMQQLKDFSEAEILYSAVLKISPAYCDCFFQLGLIEFEKEKYEDAIQFFEKAKALSYDKILCTFYITKCKDKLCKYDTKEEGKSIIEEYLKLINESVLPEGFYLALATAYAKCGNAKDALTYCQKSIESDSENYESYKLLGLIQLLYKDFEGVKNTLATAISLQSDNIELHDILSYALCQQDNMCAVKKCREKYSEIIKRFIKPKTNQSNNV